MRHTKRPRRPSRKIRSPLRARQHAAPTPHPPVLYHPPVSSQDLLCAAAIDHLESLSLTESWFSTLPSHIGHSPTLDAATRAFISANRFLLNSRDASLAVCLRDYVRAIESQRNLTSSPTGRLSDEALLSCALLGHFERTMGQRSGPGARTQTMQQTLMHLSAMQKMLLSRLNSFKTHELDYRLVSGHYMLLLEAPIATGKPSAFERLANPDPRTIAKEANVSAATRLRRLAFELMLHTPRLIADVRAAKAGLMSDTELQRLHQRAQSLLSLKDDASETTLLHRVSVRPSNADATGLTPFSFVFPTLVDFDAGFNYWHARILVLRACWLLDIPSARASMLAEGRRAATNILMSWQAGCSLFHRIRLLHAAVPVWGSISDFGVKVCETIDVRQRLLERVNNLYRGIVGETDMERLDMMSGVYAGEPLQGPVVGLYRQFWAVDEGVRREEG
ncbi:uncharacterized protein LTR77_000905 [Saxophila tyrrhenica]|uniref:Uncharacterized protein n=1 Tax=Saxophila tyrrhenica TaxID=1690608 RepID=A0AAV9PSM8_9PEZI|nr:hypothetical protein LTR77_000905 [Saxophila tyrrhenica]